MGNWQSGKFCGVQEIRKMRGFSFGQKIRRLAFKHNLPKMCAKMAPNQKTGLQKHFREAGNIDKIRVFCLCKNFGERLSSKICQKINQNRPKSENWPSGKFRGSWKHRQNEGFFVSAKIAETGFQAKSARKINQSRPKSENWPSGKFRGSQKHRQNEGFFI